MIESALSPSSYSSRRQFSDSKLGSCAMGKRRKAGDHREDGVITIPDDRYAVYEFCGDDVLVESESRKNLAKYGPKSPVKRPTEKHPVDKYTFIEFFARGNDQGRSSSSDEMPDVEVIEDLSVNRTPIVEFAASQNSFSCKSAESSLLKSYDIASPSCGVNFEAHGVRNQPETSSSKIHNNIWNIDSDDCEQMEFRESSSPSDSFISEGLFDKLSSKCKKDAKHNRTVVEIHPKYIKFEGTYFTECTMAFSSKCIRLLGLSLCGESMPYSQEWSACDILKIEYQHCESVKADVLKLHLKCNAKVDKSSAGTSGSLQLEIVVLDDHQWAKQRELIKSLDINYESAWEPVVNECLSAKSFGDIIYPEGDPDAVYLSRRDIEFLEPRMFINDTIIDFYIKYLFNKIKPQEQHRFYFFNSFFFQKLAFLGRNSSMDVVGREAFQRVQKWTRNVDIFEKDYIFIPVNFSLHWSLFVICNPRLLADVRDKDVDHVLNFPCILHMDSIRGNHRGFENLIRSYLWEEWNDRHTTDEVRVLNNFINLKFSAPQLPQQDNLFDCGLFLLHYVELFLEKAMDSTFSELLEMLNNDWFHPVEVSLKKRDQIRELICRISIETTRRKLTPVSSPSKGANDDSDDDAEIIDQQFSPCKEKMVPIDQFDGMHLPAEREEALAASPPINIQSCCNCTEDIELLLGRPKKSPMIIDVPNDDEETLSGDSPTSDENLDQCVVEDSEEENEVLCISRKDCVPSSSSSSSPISHSPFFRGMNVHIVNDD